MSNARVIENTLEDLALDFNEMLMDSVVARTYFAHENRTDKDNNELFTAVLGELNAQVFSIYQTPLAEGIGGTNENFIYMNIEMVDDVIEALLRIKKEITETSGTVH